MLDAEAYISREMIVVHTMHHSDYPCPMILQLERVLDASVADSALSSSELETCVATILMVGQKLRTTSQVFLPNLPFNSGIQAYERTFNPLLLGPVFVGSSEYPLRSPMCMIRPCLQVAGGL